MMQKKSLVLLALVALLSGCAVQPKKEIPTKPTGSDELRESPCACQKLDFEQDGYTWIG